MNTNEEFLVEKKENEVVYTSTGAHLQCTTYHLSTGFVFARIQGMNYALKSAGDHFELEDDSSGGFILQGLRSETYDLLFAEERECS